VRLQDVYGSVRSRDPAEEAMGVPGPTVSIIGSLEALEALRFLSGRKLGCAGRLLYFDGESGRMETIALERDA
jgi:molybdopterin/thiamine biosynthesis adenylyltransferase